MSTPSGRESRDDVLVVAARAGDASAMDRLARRHLPMVYNLVRRALQGDPAVDDVVQDVMVLALRQLSDLRSPGSFRSWLAAIAVRQVGSHLARDDAAARRTVPLDLVLGRPDAGAEVEGQALLRVELAGQRRQVAHAIAWTGADDRTTFSLWWLEMTGELTRPEVAAALGTSVSHAGVRIQRMREQLELSRSVVAALEAMPGCDELGEVAAEWDGAPGPYWRKRLARHVQSCRVCARATGDLMPTERLLAGLALVPVPAALTAAVLGKSSGTLTAAGAVSWLGHTVQAAATHPFAATVIVGVLAVGITVPATGWTSPPATRPQVAAPQQFTVTGPPGPPAPSPAVLPIGKVSLESAANRDGTSPSGMTPAFWPRWTGRAARRRASVPPCRSWPVSRTPRAIPSAGRTDATCATRPSACG
jgi:RNA polymerase sigma factor (sigma-70 family)